jgi:hypothetical protein
MSDGNVWVIDTRTNSYLYSAKILDCEISRLYSTNARIVAEGKTDVNIHFWPMEKSLGDYKYDSSDPQYFFSGGDKTLQLDGYPSASFYDDVANQCIFLSTNGSFWLFSLFEMGTVKLKSCHTPQYALQNAIDFKYVTPS